MALAWLSQSCAQTEDEAKSFKSHVSGFATLGAVYNSNADVGLAFSGAQTKPAYEGLSANLDSVLGLQWDYKLLPTTSIKLQAVVRAGEEFQPKLRMAYAKQVIGDNFSARVGRMRSPLFFDADSTEIGYARTVLRGPVPMYAGTSASTIIHIDGINAQWRQSFTDYLLTVDGYWGGGKFTNYDVSKEPALEVPVSANGIGDLVVSIAFGKGLVRYSHARITSYSAGGDQVNRLNQGIAELSDGLNLSAAGFAVSGNSAVAQNLRDKARLLDAYINPFNGAQTYDSLGFSTVLADFSVAGEWALLNSDAVILGKREAYQFSLSYIAGNLSPFVMISSARRVSNWADSHAITPTGVAQLVDLDKGISGLSQGLSQGAQLANITMQSLSLGLRWEIASNMAAKIQYDVFNTPDPNIPGAFKVRSFPFDNSAHLVSASLDVAF
jgi:hypothetical protein